MSVARLTPKRIRDQQDFAGTLGSGADGYAIAYIHSTSTFEMLAFDAAGTAAGLLSDHVVEANPHTQYLLAVDYDPITDHGALSGLSDNDHPQYLLATSYTAADVLSKLLTVDGASSGLDADLLDGNSSAAFLLATGATTGATSQAQQFTNGIKVGSSAEVAPIVVERTYTGTTNVNSFGTASQSIRHIVNPASAASNVHQALYATIVTDGAAFSIGDLRALQFFVRHNTAQTVAAAYGCLGQIQNNSTSTMTLVTNFLANAQNTGGGTITENNQFDAVATNSSGTITTRRAFRARAATGTIVNHYGLVVEDIVGSTLAYAIYTGAGDVMINNAYNAATDTHVRGGETTSALFVETSGSGTSDVYSGLTLGRTSSGTPAVGFGYAIAAKLKSSTTAEQDAGRLSWAWETATHASRAAKGRLTAYYTSTEREAIAWGADSSNALLGFYGVTPVARALLATGASATVDDVITALQNLGLLRQS